MKSLSEIIDWLKTPDKIPVILAEIPGIVSPGFTTMYLSSKPFASYPSDTPANILYDSSIIGGINFTESLSLSGTISLNYGDIELDNSDGSKDFWLSDYIWVNKDIQLLVGDSSWTRADFRPIFNGTIIDISSRSQNTLNIIISDKLQKLNNPISEELLPAIDTNSEVLIPVTFGEIFNATPIKSSTLVNTLEYQVHTDAVEDIIEARDNGVPISITKDTLNGKFTLDQNPYGQITCSVQGTLSDTENLLKYSEEFDNAIWIKNGVDVVINDASSPESTLTGDKLTATTSNSSVTQTVSATEGIHYIFSIWVKYVTTPATISIQLVKNSTATQFASTSFTTTASWTRIHTYGVLPAGETALRARIGGGSSFSIGEEIHAWGAQLTAGPIIYDYKATTSAATRLYPNSIASIIYEIVKNYGPIANRLSDSEIDTTNMLDFSSNNTQPVGIYIPSRENILTICNKLASSIGAQVTFSSVGLLRLVLLDLPPTGGTTYTVGPNDYEYNSISITEKSVVRASTKVSYCKNYTNQRGSIAAGVPSHNRILFEEDALYESTTDSTVQTDYKLTTEATAEETYLVKKTDAEAESLRRNNLWKTPRFVISFKAYGHLLPVELGDTIDLTDERFGLEAGASGLVVRVARDWLNNRVTIGVLV